MDNEANIELLKKEMEHMNEKIGDIQHDVSNLYERTNQISDLNTSIQLLNSTVSRLQETVDKMSAEPAKKWDLVVTGGISAIVTGLVAYVLTHLNLK